MAIEEEADAAGKEDDRNSSGTSKCLENNSNSSKRRAMCLAGHALRLGSKAKDSLVASLTGTLAMIQGLIAPGNADSSRCIGK